MQKILIYTEKITPRIQYVFDFVLREFSGLDFELTTNVQFFEASEIPKVNYSQQKIADEIYLKSDEFMFEDIISDKIKFEELDSIGKLFFALSRYEEYLPQPKDYHGRISGKGKVYKTPFVDEWILEFHKELKLKYPELEFKKRKFELVLTCDVDQAWKYRNKGFKRIYGAYLKDLVKLDFKEFAKRKRVISGKEEDPFDTFDYFKSFLDHPLRLRSVSGQNDNNLRMIFFWLMADYGQFDKNNPVENRAFQEKIKETSKWAEFGVHPSYVSNSSKEKLKTEIKRLAKTLGKPIQKSRQHYIKIVFPHTYRNLIEAGIKEDYTMGYPDETGFRAGTCTPFFWYDLKDEISTDLKVYSFCAMDATLQSYLKFTPEEAKNELRRLKYEIQKVDGQMIVLFHNSNLNEQWVGWDEVLESLF